MFLNIEVKVGSVFPHSDWKQVAYSNPWRGDVTHLLNPTDSPRADGFIIVSDVCLYHLLRGHQFRYEKGIGQRWIKGDKAKFPSILPPLEEVIARGGQTHEHYVEHDGVRLRVLARAVRPLGCRIQGGYVREEGDDGEGINVSNDWLIVVLIGVAAADEEEE